MADALRVDVGKGSEELVDVELNLENWHSSLHLVEISRSPVDSLGDIFLHQVKVDLILLPSVNIHSFAFCSEFVTEAGQLTRSPLE
jgi:hypothetical protein